MGSIVDFFRLCKVIRMPIWTAPGALFVIVPFVSWVHVNPLRSGLVLLHRQPRPLDFSGLAVHEPRLHRLGVPGPYRASVLRPC